MPRTTDMRPTAPTAHLLCGLSGAGKTTTARALAVSLPAVRFSLDEWVLRLHGTAYDHPDYPALADACRSLIRDTAAQVLGTGVDVVLDWNHWSRHRRAESRAWASALGAAAVLHHVVVPVVTAVARVEERNRRDEPYAHTLDARGVHHLATIFEPPSDAEGLEIRTVVAP